MPWKPLIPPTPAKPVEGDIQRDPYEGDMQFVRSLAGDYYLDVQSGWPVYPDSPVE